MADEVGEGPNWTLYKLGWLHSVHIHSVVKVSLE